MTSWLITFIICALCLGVGLYARHKRIQLERANRRKRVQLNRLFRAMDTERDAALDDLVRQAEEIIANRVTPPLEEEENNEGL